MQFFILAKTTIFRAWSKMDMLNKSVYIQQSDGKKMLRCWENPEWVRITEEKDGDE